MARCLTRISLALVLLLSSEVWAIGLGDINLDSALNEPLRAEIELLSATPEELANLTVTLASADTFARYGIDRPFFLQDIEFNVEPGGPNGPVVQVRSRSPITEPFLTFLVEASWSSGRLLREYTVLLDPPTYAPPAVQQAPSVEAPRRATPTDSARIERQQPVQQPTPQPTPPPAQAPVTPPPTPARDRDVTPPAPAPAPVDTSYSRESSGDYYVVRGDTLWGIAQRMRPDSRLSMNQTMLAIFEANPEAFSNNINMLAAGASLRIPSADEVFQISRGDAFAEVKRQNAIWRETTGAPSPDAVADTAPDSDYVEPVPDYAEPAPTAEEPADTQETRPSLTLVPPDEEPAGVDYDDELAATDTQTREQEIEARIADLEAADVPDQQSLIEIRDNELAALRQELAEIRGETYEVPADELIADEAADDEIYSDDVLADDTEAVTDDEAAAADAADDEAAEPAPAPTDVVSTRRAPDEPGIVETIIGWLTSTWAMIAYALFVVAGLLLWFMRRSSGGDEDESPWETLDKDELAAGAMSATETLSAPVHTDESIVVVEQDSGIRSMDDDTIEAPSPEAAAAEEAKGDTGEFGSLEDTFSSETAVNLDQSDPLAEADFHMAYGLYDQAADLVNGALEADPSDRALMSKLCEIYFVWGNRDAFIDAATRLNGALGGGDAAEWDKIVIMGQQIAADHELFAGAGVAGATKAVDLSFEADMDEEAELDMDFGGSEGADADVIDLGATEEEDGGGGGVDFMFEAEDESVDFSLDDTEESPTIESPGDTDVTAEMPAPVEPTVETPTIEQQFQGMDGTSELPSLDESLGDAIADMGQEADATAEINLDELDLDITGTNEALEDTGINEALEGLEDLEDLDDATGRNEALDTDATGIGEALDLAELQGLEDIGATGMRLAPDETGASPMLTEEEETDASLDVDLLEATGRTQVLSEDFAVETQSDAALGDDDATMLAPGYGDDDDTAVISGEETAISSDAETMLAPMDEDEEDYDFAKTEALPPEAFTGNTSLDETGEMPAVARTDVDLDLDDLTAALAVSDVGDTVEQPRDDATVEQPRPAMPDETAEVPTMSIAPEDMSDDLHEARTMTEVGTKLDLARAYVDMGDPAGARSILEEVLDEGDEGQKQQAQQLLDTLPS